MFTTVTWSVDFRLARAAFGPALLVADLAEGLPSAAAEEARRSGGEKRPAGPGGAAALLPNASDGG